MSDIMLDLETLGTSPGCVILSIGAVPFNSTGAQDNVFYDRISSADSKAHGFIVEEATEKWWKLQDPSAYKEATSGTLEIEEALVRFASYLEKFKTPVKIWGNGADFDNAILAFAYKKLGIPVPWRYSNSRCYRTLAALFPTTKKPASASHVAVEDARIQANHAARMISLHELIFDRSRV